MTNKSDYIKMDISSEEALLIAFELYSIKGEITKLPGELDFNFKIQSDKESYLLKISRRDVDLSDLSFQNSILNHLSAIQDVNSPEVLSDKDQNLISKITDENGNTRYVRLLSWMEGRLWSNVNPIRSQLLENLGESAGKLTKSLTTFNHKFSERIFEWDVAQVMWTKDHLGLFETEEKDLITYFLDLFESHLEVYLKLRKQVVHNDVNDNNIIVSENLKTLRVKAIIDYGDAVYTQTINDLAITIAYAAMNKPDPLAAACAIVKGYNRSFDLLDSELKMLYTLVACRLIISTTKSAINKKKEPENTYLLISERPAWELLIRWREIDPNLAYCSFRKACGMTAHPNETEFKEWAKSQKIDLFSLLKEPSKTAVYNLDLSVSSKTIGLEENLGDLNYMDYLFNDLQSKNPEKLIAGGYLESRIIYNTDAYKKEGNDRLEFRSQHLGIDFWLKPNTALYSLLDAEVLSIYDNGQNKDYGPTLILKHNTDKGREFYSLYGHLSSSTLDLWKPGQKVKKGDLIAYIGDSHENGNWPSHLHFQLMLDMLGNKNDFLGVAFPSEIDVWKSICPDPNLLFNLEELKSSTNPSKDELLNYRKNHLGKSLSVSYDEPLHIVRGSGAYLIDEKGQRFLDTVNNVAHVGHENARVVKAGQEQMALLNTNTRYLHPTINDFAKELLDTFPEDLSVVHFVNSGSEANELALRMAKNYSGEKDIIAVEVGYHGNTNACVDISSYKFDGKGGNGAPEHTHIIPLPDAYRGIYQRDDSGLKYAFHINEQIEKVEKKGRGLAAFICESIISCGGQIELPKGFLKKAYQEVREAGALCIADEVQVGLGRLGKAFWGFQLHDVIPDIVTIGKPLGNGHPVAAVVCTRKVAESFANGMEYFNTFGGNPVSCSIGLEVLKEIKREKLQENAVEVGEFLKSKLKELQREFPIIGDVRGQGLFLGFELVDDEKKALPEQACYLVNRMRDKGILMSTDGKDNNVIKIKPPLVFSKSNADQLIVALKQIFVEDPMDHYI